MPRDTAVGAELADRQPGPTYFLLAGSDSREALPDDAEDRFGPLTRQHADIVVVAAVDGDAVRVLSLPRDLRVDTGEYGPIVLAQALSLGGSPQLVRAVRSVTGLPVHHYVGIDMRGFARVVDAVGGVTINFCERSRDVKTGLEVAAGPQRLDGENAVAFVRSRRFERLQNGSWLAVAQGDENRIGRQQLVVAKLLDEMGVRDLPSLARLSGSAVTVDAALGTGTVAGLVNALRGDRVEMRTLPAVPLRTWTDRASPFRPVHSGGYGYLVPAAGVGESLAWVAGLRTDAQEVGVPEPEPGQAACEA